MKQKTMEKLTGCEYVSTYDLASALCWMLKAETRAAIRPVCSEDLPIKGTTLHFPIDSRRANSPVIPQNYFGNALHLAAATFDSDGEHTKTFIDVLARAASLSRAAINAIRTEPEAQFESLLSYYRFAVRDFDGMPSDDISLLTSYQKMPFDDIDFGNGPPYHRCTLPTFPTRESHSLMNFDSDGDGLLVYFIVSTRHKELLKTSSVLTACAPGVSVFFE